MTDSTKTLREIIYPDLETKIPENKKRIKIHILDKISNISTNLLSEKLNLKIKSKLLSLDKKITIFLTNNKFTSAVYCAITDGEDLSFVISSNTGLFTWLRKELGVLNPIDRDYSVFLTNLPNRTKIVTKNTNDSIYLRIGNAVKIIPTETPLTTKISTSLVDTSKEEMKNGVSPRKKATPKKNP